MATGGLVPAGAPTAIWPTTCEKKKTPVRVWPEKPSSSGLASVPSCTDTDCAAMVSPSTDAAEARVLSRSFAAAPPPRVNGRPAPAVTEMSKASATPAGVRSMVPVAMEKVISPSPKDMVSGLTSAGGRSGRAASPKEIRRPSPCTVTAIGPLSSWPAMPSVSWPTTRRYGTVAAPAGMVKPVEPAGAGKVTWEVVVLYSTSALPARVTPGMPTSSIVPRMPSDFRPPLWSAQPSTLVM